jgi:hypothetical protein
MRLRALLFLAMLPLFAPRPAVCEEAVPPGLEGVPEVVAEVNNRQILRDDLVREMAGSGANDAIGRLVQRNLVEQGAKEKGVSISEQDIEQQYNADRISLTADFVGTPWEKTPPEAIIQAHYGMSIDEYKKLVIRQRLLTRKSVGEGGLAPSDATLMDFFVKENRLFQPPVKYHAEHILISPFDPRDLYRSLRMSRPETQMDAYNSERRWRINRERDQGVAFKDEAVNLDPVWNRSRQLAERVLREIKTGQISFADAVKKYTQDPVDQPSFNRLIDNERKSERERAGLPPGDVGWFSEQGPMVDQFFKGVKDLKPGEIGGPVQTPYGFHIVRMLEIREPPPVTFEFCKDAVYRAFTERQMSTRAEAWMATLEEGAVIHIFRERLWPVPRRNAVALPDAGAQAQKEEEADPVVADINGTPIKRSEVWHEMVRADGDAALTRLINMEIVMTMLREMGHDRLDWECADPARRPPKPPALKPIRISREAVDLEMNIDRLRHDAESPNTDFRDYIFAKFGQSVDDYRRKLEAGLILLESVRQKISVDDGTLQVQFALAKERYASPEWYEISHILIVPTGGMQNADRNAHGQAKLIADQLYRQAQAQPTQENFVDLVRNFSMDERPAVKSRDGKLGECSLEGANPDLPEATALYREIRRQKLEKGQVSMPIRTFRGYQIVRIDAKHPEMPAIYSNVKKRVERDYLGERAKMYSDIWMRSLRNRARVKKYMYNHDDELIFDAQRPDYFPLPKE